MVELKRLFAVLISAMLVFPMVFANMHGMDMENEEKKEIRKGVEESKEIKNIPTSAREKRIEYLKKLEEERKYKLKMLKQKARQLGIDEKKAAILLTKEELEKLSEEDIEELKEKLREREEYAKKGWKIREVKLEEKEKRIKEIKEKVKEIREKIRKHKEKERELKELKKELKECEESGYDTEECAQVREEFMNKSKEYLITAIDAAIEHLTSVKNKLEVSEYLNESEVQNAIQNIEDLVGRLTALKGEVSACDSLECLRDVALKLKRELNMVKIKVKEKVYEEEKYRKGLIIERGKAILARLEFLIEYAKSKNISLDEYAEDIEEIKQLVYEAEQYKVSADEHMRQAKEAIDNGDINGAQKHLELAKEALEEAKDRLKEANELLQEIWNEIKRYRELRYVMVAKEEALENVVVEVEKEYEREEEETEVEEKEYEEIEEEEKISIYGRMYYENIEGGVWIVEDEIGNKYQIVNLDDFGLGLSTNTTYEVSVEGYVMGDVVTTAMVGTPLKAVEIEIESESDVVSVEMRGEIEIEE